MSRTKFIKETTDCFYFRQKNNLPVHISEFSIDKFIRDKWITENRHNELISHILDEWDNGDFNDHTDFIEEYEIHLLKNKLSKEFIKLWKGILRIRIESLWWYFRTCKLNNNEFISKNSEVRLRETSKRQNRVLEGIERFTKGLKSLEENEEINKLELIKESITKLEPSKPNPTTDKRKIDESLFWELIEMSRKESEDKTDFLIILKRKLSAFNGNEIKKFGKYYALKVNELNSWDNWALAYIVRRGCGDDEFDYFKAWVISMGLNSFNIVLNFEMEKFKELFESEDCQFEEFIDLTESVFEEKTNEIMKPIKVKLSKIAGKEWNEKNIENEYSELYKMFT
jgi:hypothetical protein